MSLELIEVKYFSCFSPACDQILDKKQLEEEMFIFREMQSIVVKKAWSREC